MARRKQIISCKSNMNFAFRKGGGTRDEDRENQAQGVIGISIGFCIVGVWISRWKFGAFPNRWIINNNKVKQHRMASNVDSLPSISNNNIRVRYVSKRGEEWAWKWKQVGRVRGNMKNQIPFTKVLIKQLWISYFKMDLIKMGLEKIF